MAQTISDMRIHRDIVAVITTTVSLLVSAALVSVWTAVLSAGAGTHVITSERINLQYMNISQPDLIITQINCYQTDNLTTGYNPCNMILI